MMLAALSIYHAGMPQVAIVGPHERDDTRALRGVVRATYLPAAVQVLVDPSSQAALARSLPWIGPLTMRDGRSTAYVCQNFVCNAPVTEAGELQRQLAAMTPPIVRSTD